MFITEYLEIQDARINETIRHIFRLISWYFSWGLCVGLSLYTVIEHQWNKLRKIRCFCPCQMTLSWFDWFEWPIFSLIIAQHGRKSNKKEWSYIRVKASHFAKQPVMQKVCLCHEGTMLNSRNTQVYCANFVVLADMFYFRVNATLVTKWEGHRWIILTKHQHSFDSFCVVRRNHLLVKRSFSLIWDNSTIILRHYNVSHLPGWCTLAWTVYWGWALETCFRGTQNPFADASFWV